MNILFYKEWIKTRWYLLLMLFATTAFVSYALLRIHRVIEMKGAGHVWEVMIVKEVLFVDILQYIPFVVGLLLALVQFVPEMYHKCLKLTLHLPYSQWRLTYSMLLFGILMLTACFVLNNLLMLGYLQQVFAVELYSRILLSALPWYVAGLAAYLLCAWICLEPTWKCRVLNMVIALLLLRLFFLAPAPEAYNGFLPWLIGYTLLLCILSWISVTRFKAGKQD